MADRELAAKLERRFASLSVDTDSATTTTASEASKQPPPPPVIPLREATPPYRAIVENADIDQLISEALDRRFTAVLRKAPAVEQPSRGPDRAPPRAMTPPPEGDPRQTPLALAPVPPIPVFSVEHHKNSSRSQPTLDVDDALLQKERNELEAKLARQRQKKPSNKPDLLAGIDAPRSDVADASLDAAADDRGASQMSPGGDSGICVRSPPPVAKKPSQSAAGSVTQGPVSPACSSTSNRSNFSDESEELVLKLARRNMISEGEAVEPAKAPKLSLYSEFHEFSRKQIKYFIETFKRFDEDGDSFIDFNELKRMMERLGEAQTHIALKSILKLVDEDKDGRVSLREFMLIFRYAATGQLSCSEVFNQLASSVDVTKEGVQGAATFFQAKIEQLTKGSKFEEEIKEEREERMRVAEEKKERRQQFLANKSMFLP